MGLMFEIQECGRTLEDSNLGEDYREQAKRKPKQRAALLYINKSGHNPVASYHVTFPVRLAIKANLGTTLALTRLTDRLCEREGQRSLFACASSWLSMPMIGSCLCEALGPERKIEVQASLVGRLPVLIFDCWRLTIRRRAEGLRLGTINQLRVFCKPVALVVAQN